jgi:hypothetical protein
MIVIPFQVPKWRLGEAKWMRKRCPTNRFVDSAHKTATGTPVSERLDPKRGRSIWFLSNARFRIPCSGILNSLFLDLKFPVIRSKIPCSCTREFGLKSV